MVVLKFANGEYLHSVRLDPFHYIRTTERAEAQVYQYSSAALQDADLIKNETGATAELESAPLVYEIRVVDDGTVTINASKDVLDRIAVALAFLKSGIGHVTNADDPEYADFVHMVDRFQFASTFFPEGSTVTPAGMF